MTMIQKVLQLKSLSTKTKTKYHVSIAIYNAQQKQYPKSKQEWDQYDGIIITGSLSAAYDNKKKEETMCRNKEEQQPQHHTKSKCINWIQCLMDVIQTNIHTYQRKTIGVCFGHQIFAHSFEKKEEKEELNVVVEDKKEDSNNDYGLAVKCPKGMQVGLREFISPLPLLLGAQPHKTITATTTGQNHTKRTIKMLYTHGDMVQSIPHCALSLGGNNSIVPIQSCAYFASSNDKDAYLRSVSSSSSSPQQEREHEYEQKQEQYQPLPYAITFQGHPEYASREVGLGTYLNILSYLEENKKIPGGDSILAEAKQDAIDCFDDIENECVHLMKNVMTILGWIV